MKRNKKQDRVIKQTQVIEEKPKVNSVSNLIDAKWKVILFLFGFLLYANTISFDYALDDKIVITANQITKQGFDGVVDHFFYDSMDGFWAEQYGISVQDLKKDALVAGGRYRPLSLVTYAIEWELFGERPGLSHFVNAVLYGITGLILFLFLIKLFPIKGIPIWKSISFWATLLFLSHPLHVEVVANIKSRDEILSLLFGVLALTYIWNYAKSKEFKSLVLSFLMLFLSLMSKETTIAFVAIGPLMLYFFNVGDSKSWKTSFIVLFASGLLYTLIRFMVIGSPDDPIANELMNSPFINATESERLATIFLILAAYVKLLFFPFPLTHDYYPYHLPFLAEEEHYANFGSLGAIVGVFIMIGLLWVIARGLKSKSIYSFLALFFLGTTILISNLFFPIGVFMNERFMFIPSVAFAVLMSYLLLDVIPNKFSSVKKETIIGGFGIVVLIFSGLSLKRSVAWENDSSLALTDVMVSTGSAKINMAAGDALVRELETERNQSVRTEMIQEAYSYLNKSLEIYPTYFPPLDLLGKLYFEAGNYKESVNFYKYCALRKPNEKKFVENIFIVGNKLSLEQRFEEATMAYDTALSLLPNESRYLLAMSQVLARDLGRPAQALPYMERAYGLNNQNLEVAEKLAVTYAMLGRFQDAIIILEPLLEANPNNSSIMKNLGVAYYQSGQVERGTQLVDQSQLMQ